MTTGAPFGIGAVLISDWPRMTSAGRQKVEHLLSLGCSCQADDAQPRAAALTKRSTGVSVQIWLQCQTCGSGLRSALSRQDHYNWQDYKVFDENLRAAYDQQRREEIGERWKDQQAEWAERRDAMRAAYAVFLQTAEWRALRARVLRRADYRCEVCGERPAQTAHHLSYELGFAPPLWHLRAVCGECHDRLHADKRGLTDEWCP